MKIKKVAVVFQNNIQFEAFKEAVYVMQKRDIQVDIYIPINNQDDGFGDMFNAIYNQLLEEKFNIYREPNNISYDILFQPYQVFYPDIIQRKYTVKYMYGYITKPEYSLSLKNNYNFDCFLCYGPHDAKCLANFGKTFQIGNIKFFNSQNKKNNKNKKRKILYLPTYGDYSSIDILGPEFVKLKTDYDISIKLHHGTEYLKDSNEQKRKKFIQANFENIYSSKDSLSQLINQSDVIITDMSGAIFDAICLDKPVIVYYKDSQGIYEDYVSPFIKYIKSHNLLSLNEKDMNLSKKIKLAFKEETLEMQKRIKKEIVCCANNQTKDKFKDFLDAVENNFIDDEYYSIHKRMKAEISDYEKKLQKIQVELNKKQNQNKELEKEILNLKDWIKNIDNEYNKIIHSFSWKITKPLRKIKSILLPPPISKN